MIISERIFQLLKERRISQKEFSDRTGISQSTISDWKRKKTNPASDKIMIICSVLEISPYELLGGTEKPKYRQTDHFILDKSSEDFLLLESIHHLEARQKERLFGYLEALQGK